MPFGEELGAGVGGRTENLKYSVTGTDPVRKRFTGYEKDGETDLDYAQARMYGNSHGRFTSVDPFLASAFALDPQTFNHYTYTGNNPVNRIDPSGLRWVRDGTGIYWIPDDEDLNGREDVTTQEITLAGGCDGVAGCVGYGVKVRFNEERSITILSGTNGKPVVDEVVEVVNETVELVETTAADIAATLTAPFSSAPTGSPTIDLPTGSPGPGGGPLEPIGGSDTTPDGGADTGGDAAAGSGDWKLIAAQILYTLGSICWQTSCWERAEEAELYRGVAGPRVNAEDWERERFTNALRGMAIPRGGPATPEEHNDGDTDSIYTSWTTDISVAEDNAKYPDGGVILTHKFPRWRLVKSPDKYGESEVLVVGPVTGSKVQWIRRR